jgi:hypothetical protein
MPARPSDVPRRRSRKGDGSVLRAVFAGARAGNPPAVITGPRPRCAAAVGLLLTVPTALAGCASAAAPDVRAVASSFAAGDPQSRCDLLAPDTLTSLLARTPSCPDALGQLPLGRGEVTSVEVWGQDALVHLTDDTLFLTLDDSGWRVSAAACEPAGQDRPYKCQLEGS